MSTAKQLRSLSTHRGRGRPRRPRTIRRRAVVGAVLLVVASIGVRAAGDAWSSERRAGGAARQVAGTAEGVDAVVRLPEVRPAPAPQQVDATAPEAAVTPAPLARVDDLVVSLPSPDVLLVGYHEASLRGALALVPVGGLRGNENPTRFTAPPDDLAGPGYHVLSSRGRPLPATSAVDLVMRDDTQVHSPVDGVVTEVRRYRLYGSHPDTRIEIRPDAAPHRRLVLIHVDDVRVRRGDRVTAGGTVLAGTANRFPFASHVDRYLDRRWPHVHLEVKDPGPAGGRG